MSQKAITYSKDALKTLRRCPKNVSVNIRAKIENYANDPASLANNVVAMVGMPGYARLRVGDWRVIFKDETTVLAIIRIAVRGQVYD